MAIHVNSILHRLIVEYKEVGYHVGFLVLDMLNHFQLIKTDTKYSSWNGDFYKYNCPMWMIWSFHNLRFIPPVLTQNSYAPKPDTKLVFWQLSSRLFHSSSPSVDLVSLVLLLIDKFLSIIHSFNIYWYCYQAPIILRFTKYTNIT